MNVEIFARVSSALRQFLAASPLVGHDCYLHSVLGNDLLRRLGLETQIRIGYAAWRTGAGDFDVVANPLAHDGDTVNPADAVCYHCWLQTDAGKLIDLTTHSLGWKVAARNGDGVGNW